MPVYLIIICIRLYPSILLETHLVYDVGILEQIVWVAHTQTTTHALLIILRVPFLLENRLGYCAGREKRGKVGDFEEEKELNFTYNCFLCCFSC